MAEKRRKLAGKFWGRVYSNQSCNSSDWDEEEYQRGPYRGRDSGRDSYGDEPRVARNRDSGRDSYGDEPRVARNLDSGRDSYGDEPRVARNRDFEPRFAHRFTTNEDVGGGGVVDLSSIDSPYSVSRDIHNRPDLDDFGRRIPAYVEGRKNEEPKEMEK